MLRNDIIKSQNFVAIKYSVGDRVIYFEVNQQVFLFVCGPICVRICK